MMLRVPRPPLPRSLVHVLRMPQRLLTASRYQMPTLRAIARWLVHSRERTNFTYDLTPLSLTYLCATVAVVTGRPVAEIERYVAEAQQDEALAAHIRRAVEGSPLRRFADPVARFGRRLAWYAVVRALRPAVVVETGVDKGLGAVLLCSALLRNADEGASGRYFGTDLEPSAGLLLSGPYASVGRILVGDSIESLRQLGGGVDVFINDSDHSTEYEYREYDTIRERLGPGAVVIGDNAHLSDSLQRFARETGRRFLFFAERPHDHWYPGAGVGFAFGRALTDRASAHGG